MITRKLWNSFINSTRLDILNLCKVDPYYYPTLQEPYHHDFNYNNAGKELLKVLNRCYKEASGQLKICSWIIPTYEEEKPVKQAKKVIKKQDSPYGTCCACGKPLTREDKYYYDLDSYCIKCAIADGIRTSED